MPTITLGDLDVYFERHGAGDPVLFINGTNGDLRFIPTLGSGPLERAFDTCYFDQRGLGRTSIPPGPYSMAMYADDAAALIRAQGWSSCHVVGVSFGGMVAQELVLRHPSLVRRLVLCCTSSGGAGGASFDLLAIDDLPPEERMRVALSVLDERNDTTTDPWTPAPGMAPIIAGMRARPQQDGDARRGARLQLEARAHHDTWERLPTVAAPTLVIGGRYDRQAPVDNLERLAERIPGAQLQFCDGGHIFLAQDPSAWPAIVAFLRG